MKIGFIGAGNMAEALTGAMIKSGLFSSTLICASDISKERLDLLKDTCGIAVTDNNFKLFLESDVVILAVKPQQLKQVLISISEQKEFKITKRKLVISIAAGYPIKKIEEILYSSLDKKSKEMLPVIRVMPNTPALALAGISGMCINKFTTQKDAQLARKIMETSGKVIEFKEEDFDGVTALSGSGPAYVFYLIESMIQGGIESGLDHARASVLTIETVKGAAVLLEQLNESPELLRRKVTSPGGTTEAAIKVLDNANVKQNIIKAILAAVKRSKELG